MKNQRLRSNDGFANVLGLSRAPFGSSWGLLGGSWELLGASRSTKESPQIRLGTFLGLVCSFLGAEDGLGRVLGPYPPTFKNVGFTV